jgi:hypothetical protein
MNKIAFKACLALSAALTLCVTLPAQAKRVTNDRVAVDSSVVTDDAVMYPGPIGAMLEANYFHAAQPDPFSTQCRLRTYFFAQQMRLARYCD